MKLSATRPDVVRSFETWREERPEQYQRFLADCDGDPKQARAAWIAINEEAAAEAMQAERPRCTAHAELGFACGNLSLAIEGVESGATIASMADRYLTAALSAGAEKAKPGMWDVRKPGFFAEPTGARVQLVQQTLKRWRAQGVA